MSLSFSASLKARPVQEFVNLLFFRPLAYGVARVLYPTPVSPPMLVLFHTLLGLVTAYFVALRPELDWVSALLLQLKTVLDNADGQLARLRDQADEMGRYLDSEADLLVNVALFGALGLRTGEPWLSLAGFAVFTLVQSWDFNAEYLYRAARGEPFRPPVRDPDSPLLSLLRGIYAVFYAPQDRWVRGLEHALFARLTRGVDEARRQRLALEWWNLWSVAAVVNFGLTSQFVFMGLFLLFHEPGSYLTFVLLQGAYLGLVYLWRILRLLNIRSRP
ncbi:CDP-alcohol phosphatidyltransferase family protein [Calidithermus chliarophilus]|uniref:CDP-alcohol phosphatidyltransferase family protein n=1 Tax=Calidithermus chliarophilus TaxID=52023 RepID=UPI0004014A5F|nr:CDP-alcohol phosphatidyltransferase family protein [Calidithermus chliarophilus]